MREWLSPPAPDVVWRFLRDRGFLAFPSQPTSTADPRPGRGGGLHYLPTLRPQFLPLGNRTVGPAPYFGLGWSQAGGEERRSLGSLVLIPRLSTALFAGPGGVTHVVVREDPCYSSGAPLAMGMLAGAATGAALGSLMWSPCWF